MEVDWKHTRSEFVRGCVRAVLSKVFATDPTETRSRRRFQIGTPGRWNDHRSTGASLSLGLPDLGPRTNRGPQSAKEGTHRPGGGVDPSHSGNLRPRLIGYSGSRRDANAPVTLSPKNRIRLAIKLRRSASEGAQIVAGLSEPAVASASVSSALTLLHQPLQTSIGSEWSVSD